MWRHRGVRVAGVVASALILVFALGGQVIAPPNPPTPPTIDDLVGAWSFTENWIGYDCSVVGSAKERDSEKGTCTITKLGPTTVNMQFAGNGLPWNLQAIYSQGVLLSGSANDSVLAITSWTQYLFVRGRPGHLTAKGKTTAYMGTRFWTMTWSLKQLQP